MDLKRCHIREWQQFGSSHNRTATQKADAIRAVREHLTGLPASTLPVFTDGSALSNPGPSLEEQIWFRNAIYCLEWSYWADAGLGWFGFP